MSRRGVGWIQDWTMPPEGASELAIAMRHFQRTDAQFQAFRRQAERLCAAQRLGASDEGYAGPTLAALRAELEAIAGGVACSEDDHAWTHIMAALAVDMGVNPATATAGQVRRASAIALEDLPVPPRGRPPGKAEVVGRDLLEYQLRRSYAEMLKIKAKDPDDDPAEYPEPWQCAVIVCRALGVTDADVESRKKEWRRNKKRLEAAATRAQGRGTAGG